MASFTRAAAKELISRDQVIADDQIGTLHAHCYRLLGKPELAEVKAKEFNEEYPHLSITPSGNIKLDDGLIAQGLPAADALKETRGEAISDLDDAERAALRRVLSRANGNVSQAAQMLGISRATLHRKMKRFQLH